MTKYVTVTKVTIQTIIVPMHNFDTFTDQEIIDIVKDDLPSFQGIAGTTQHHLTLINKLETSRDETRNSDVSPHV